MHEPLTVGACLRELADEMYQRRNEILKRAVVFDIVNELVDEWCSERNDPARNSCHASCPNNAFTCNCVQIVIYMRTDDTAEQIFRLVSKLQTRMLAMGLPVEFRKSDDTSMKMRDWLGTVKDPWFSVQVRAFMSANPDARCAFVEIGKKEEPVYELRCLGEKPEDTHEAVEAS